MTNESSASPSGEEQKEESLTPTSPTPENECDSFKKEAAEFKDKYLRLLAEMENTRKRMQKERQELTQYAIEKLIEEFLSPIDHMENALKFTQDQSDDVKHWALGFQMILNQFKDVLANNGVKSFESEGKPFDPHCHEAVETVDSEEMEPGIVAKEFIRGYKMGDRTIRPARVQVTKS